MTPAEINSAIFDKSIDEWVGYAQLEEMWAVVQKRYPALFDGKDIGSQVGAGWWPLLETAFVEIVAVMQQYPDYRFAVRQIKEKFGGLRFYYNIVPAAGEVDDDEDDRSSDYAVRSMIGEAVGKIIDAAENEAYGICEVCGEPGHHTNTGWVKVLCDKHEAVMVDKEKAQWN
jgi:hypothetical protein